MMTAREILKNLIDNNKKPTVADWVFNVESFLKEIEEGTKETSEYIEKIKQFGDEFQYCENLVAWLRQLYKRKYDSIEVPPITKRNQIFVAMMFSDETNDVYRFDNLCNDISKGLPAEIEARQKQYEFYRDKLLNFKDIEEDGEKETKAKGTGKN